MSFVNSLVKKAFPIDEEIMSVSIPYILILFIFSSAYLIICISLITAILVNAIIYLNYLNLNSYLVIILYTIMIYMISYIPIIHYFSESPHPKGWGFC